MGRTIRSITMEFLAGKASFSAFQRALDELFTVTQVLMAEANYAANPLPMETFRLPFKGRA
jgi:hypothetical protein